MNVLALLRERFAAGPRCRLVSTRRRFRTSLGMLLPSQDAKFGDYQANFAMPLGKKLGKPPREIAQQLVALVELADVCEPPEVAGPGFINLRLKNDWIVEQLAAASARRRADRRRASRHSRGPIVVDYSSPNVAKPMHVGHIRSTVIGDALYRILKFLGHHTISDNHLGDWGTQFGMIIYGYKHFRDEAALASQAGRRAQPALSAGARAGRVPRDAARQDSRPQVQDRRGRAARRASSTPKPRRRIPKNSRKRRSNSNKPSSSWPNCSRSGPVSKPSSKPTEADPQLGPLLEPHADIARRRAPGNRRAPRRRSDQCRTVAAISAPLPGRDQRDLRAARRLVRPHARRKLLSRPPPRRREGPRRQGPRPRERRRDLRLPRRPAPPR